MVKPDPKIDIKTRLIGIQTVIKCYAKHITTNKSPMDAHTFFRRMKNFQVQCLQNVKV